MIAHATYKLAADRIRRGEACEMDEAVCDVYDAQHSPRDRRVIRTVLDLPMAAEMWRTDAREVQS